MRVWPVIRLMLIFCALLSLAMLFPLLAAIVFQEDVMILSFGISIAAVLVAALPLVIFSKRHNVDFTINEGILLVCLAWIAGSLLGAAPYCLSGFFPRFSDAVFESVSGFTSTGATTIPHLDSLPRSLHLWRSMIPWLGGMGIVVLGVAFVPLVGAGGFQMSNTGTAGPGKEKFTPRMTATAKALALIYIGLTVIMIALLMLGGMDWLDAVAHAFSTLGTGGFSTKNAGLAAWNSPYIEWVCIAFMLIAGFNFSLTYRLLQGKYREVAKNSEARAYILIIIVAALVVAVQIAPYAGSPGESLRHAFFEVVSIVSTTGFKIDDHNQWPRLAQFAVFVLMLAGGCSGSAAGGIKIIRHVILFKQTKNELLRTLYPRGIFSIQLDGKPAGKDLVFGAGSFCCLYGIMIALGTLLVSSAGTGLYDSLNVALLTLGNIGAGFGHPASGAFFYEAPEYIKWGLSALMIIGRLEIFSFIILFHPEFWKNNF